MQHAPQKSRPKVMGMMSVWVALPPPHKHPKSTMHQDLESAQTLDWGTGSGSGCGTAQASKGMLMYWYFGEPSAFLQLDPADYLRAPGPVHAGERDRESSQIQNPPEQS